MVKKTLLLLFLVLSGFAIGFAQLSDEERQTIIARLDSTDNDQDLKALSDIVKNNIVEAVPLIEQKIWQRYNGSWDVYLDALLHFHAPGLSGILKLMIDSSDVVGTRPFQMGALDIPPFWNPEGIRVLATRYLFKLGDYSTAQYVFEALHQGESISAYQWGFALLKDIAKNDPEYRDSARAELLRIARNASYSGDRGRAQGSLIEVFGSEVFPDIVYWARNDSDGGNRLYAIRSLCTLNYPELHAFLRERLAEEPFTFYKAEIAESLLTRFGTIEDYVTVENYISSESSPANRLIVEDALREFKPPVPLPTVPILTLLDTLVSRKHQSTALAWLADNNFVNELDNGLENARKHLARADSVNAYKEIQKFQEKVQQEYDKTQENEKKNKPRDKRFVTTEGYKFLYYDAQYILDRLPAEKAKKK